MSPTRSLLMFVSILITFPAMVAMADDLTTSQVQDFETRVRPLLVDHCYKCHSTASEKVRGGLLLDTREGLLRGGETGPAVVPGKPEESLLIEAIRYEDPAYQMPPKGKLPDEAIATLTDWIKRGAPDPRAGASVPVKKSRVIDLEEEAKHWAYQPLQDVEPPVSNSMANPIDRFLEARRFEHGLTASPLAERRILIRRLTFDLTGLPPTPDEIQAFLSDQSEDAYPNLVDRLLASPRMGERWARHWLDLARWGESHGFEHDYDRPTAYPYRDFVIEAINQDLPYDKFVKWQIAGDELEPENPLAMKATGFLAAGTHSTQITANQVEKERYDELDDMVNTTGTAFLGLTFGCARCHDHKFDPIPTRDYYRLAATFTTTVRSEVELNLDPDGFKQAVAKHDVEHQPYVDRLQAFEHNELASRFRAWETSRPSQPDPPRWVALDASKVESRGGATLTKTGDGRIVASGPNPESDTYTFTAPCDLASITAVKIEALADSALVAGGPGRASNGNFALTNLGLTIGPRFGIGATETATLINPKATFEQPGLVLAAAIDDDPKSGWAVDPQFGRDHAAVFELARDVQPDGGATLTFTLDFQNNAGHNFGAFRISVTDAPRPVGLDASGLPAKIAAILAIPESQRNPEQSADALAWYKSIDPAWRTLKAALDDHEKTAPKLKGEKAMIATEGLPAVRLHTQGGDFLEQTHLLRRGDPNQKAEVVDAGFLQVLSHAPESRWKTQPPEGWRTSYRRVGLANWMTDTEQGAGHLLARVIVNRLWQHHFGRGLVSTPSDFGKQGEPPSHPEVLDWLASELIRGGWRLKPIHRLIVLSQAYRQTSDADPAKLSVDPENVWLWRYPKRRLEAEAIHDAMLSVSGTLDERMFGPGSLDERMPRRAIYFTVKRSKLIPMMTLFDAPDALSGLAARGTTTIAPQSLLIMNSPIVRGWASSFAKRVQGKAAASEDQIKLAYEIAIGRPPDDRELIDALAFLKDQAHVHAEISASDANTLALTDLCHVLMGLNEFIFIE